MRQRGRPSKRSQPEAAVALEARLRLLDAAQELFAERGFSGAGTRDIAALAGVNQGLIAYHFGGKEALFREVAERGLRALLTGLDADPSPGAPPLTLWLSTLATQRQRVQLLVHALLEPGPRREWLIAQLRPLATRARRLAGADTQAAGVRGELQLLTYVVASAALAAFGPALEAGTGRSLDGAGALAIQRELLERFFTGGSALTAGPWSPRRTR